MRMPHVLAAAALLAAACTLPAAAQETAVQSAAAPGWSYAGPTAPAFWRSRLGFTECIGPRQSPVDLPDLPFAAPLGVSVTYPETYPGHLVNDGHTVRLLLVNTTASLRVAASTFTFKEMHIHVPAEHTVQGRRHAAEIHAVHVERGVGAAALTTFVREGDHNEA